MLQKHVIQQRMVHNKKSHVLPQDGKIFKPKGTKSQSFCSLECYWNSLKKWKDRPCKYCGKMFFPKSNSNEVSHCNWECYRNSKRYPREIKNVETILPVLRLPRSIQARGRQTFEETRITCSDSTSQGMTMGVDDLLASMNLTPGQYAGITPAVLGFPSLGGGWPVSDITAMAAYYNAPVPNMLHIAQ